MAAKFFDFSDRDVMCPSIEAINGMFFRVNPVSVDEGDKLIKKTQQSGRYPPKHDDIQDVTEDFSVEETEILYKRSKKAPDGTFHLLLDQENLPQALYAMVIGKGGQAKKIIEEATSARIVIPEKREQERGKSIEIISYDDVQLVLCRRRLLASFQNCRMRNPFTHFVCFPLFSTAVRQRFQVFKDEVTEKCGGARGFSQDLFQNPKKLHLTVGTLVLYNPRESDVVMESVEASVSDCLSKLSSAQTLTFRLRGLEIMNDDPTDVDVLYGKIEDPSGILQKLADRIYRHLARASPRFLLDQHENRDFVKLHATLMNSRFRKGEEVGEDDAGGNMKRKAFDASGILQQFGAFDFGECELAEVHLSQRYSSGEDGFYRPTRMLKIDASFFTESGDTVECYGDEPNCHYDEKEFEGEM
ncbi:activating signal cointegrator 1 complex subunit 1-like isoform X2 [Paramacrobiotus metropolitanus]|uniref:activating signal cointegrator 1 complex subunit 1-like isoform X2 n=1 Tax=Paramacrobiotus metropolitanus TaxID=2943436 RepID=UPI002445BE9D|nr:activating signal cointegrator 1 complex subunit 1-like isoform X2 [Paramacrobiotus metropolitanus]